MSNPETILLQEIRLALAEIPGTVLWRNPIGFDARAHVNYGVGHVGGSDLLGFSVRNGMAIFTAIEIKTKTGIVSDEQKRFIALVRRHGGLAGIARSAADAKDITDGLIRD